MKSRLIAVAVLTAALSVACAGEGSPSADTTRSETGQATGNASSSARPSGWALVGKNPEAYTFAVDSPAHGGRQSGALTAAQSGRDSVWAVTQQLVRADRYRGKRVRLAGYLRTQDAGSAWLWLRIDGNSEKGPLTIALDNMSDRPVRGTSDWQRVAIVLDVPAEATLLAFGHGLFGSGKAWVDDITIETVARSVRLTRNVLGGVVADTAAAGRELQARVPTLRQVPTNLDFELPAAQP